MLILMQRICQNVHHFLLTRYFEKEESKNGNSRQIFTKGSATGVDIHAVAREISRFIPLWKI